MIGRVAFVGVILGAALLILAGCSKIEPSETLRYRLTVEVETPEGVKSGYSVWEYTIKDIAIGFTQAEGNHRGEAVSVDLPNGQTLFALLISGDGTWGHPRTVIDEWLKTYPGYTLNDNKNFLTAFPGWSTAGTSWVVERKLHADCVPSNSRSCIQIAYPMLVTFKDAKDPTSVIKVDPDDLTKSFGSGYKLRSITVTATTEPVTEGIENNLVWLTDENRKRFDPNHKPKGIPLGDYRGLFSKEISK